jgi:hypothetical protein
MLDKAGLDYKMVNISKAGIVVIVSTLVTTAFIIPTVKALTDATLSELLTNSPERFLIQMNYPEMVNKSLTQ